MLSCNKRCVFQLSRSEINERVIYNSTELPTYQMKGQLVYKTNVNGVIVRTIFSGYDSTDEENDGLAASRARSVPPQSGQVRSAKSQDNILGNRNFSPNHLRAVSEADLLRSHGESEDYQRGGGGRRPRSRTSRTSRRSSSHDRLDGKSESSVENQDHLGLYGGGRLGGRNEPKLRHRTASQLSVARQVWSLMQSAFCQPFTFLYFIWRKNV